LNTWKFEVTRKVTRKEEKVTEVEVAVQKPVQYECKAPKVSAAKVIIKLLIRFNFDL
jgi:hypothetical protein